MGGVISAFTEFSEYIKKNKKGTGYTIFVLNLH